MGQQPGEAGQGRGIFARLDQLNEFERQPVGDDRLYGGGYFAGSFAGEHVAATEFVIGALFVVWGATTYDVLVGLLLGNLLAVLSWTLICAPIAVKTRLTLYWYLRQIGGPVVMVAYNVLNALLYCVLAGCMITVAASAVRIPLGIKPQTGWLPTDPWFVPVVIVVGAVMVTLAILGFRRLAQFASLCSPWMLLMFVAGALVMLPQLGEVRDFASLRKIADEKIWTGSPPAFESMQTVAGRSESRWIRWMQEQVGGRLGWTMPTRAYDEIHLHFSGEDGELQSVGGGPLRGFAVTDQPLTDGAEADSRTFVEAEARIKHDAVVVFHPDVLHPQAVRYQQPSEPEGALCNSSLIPVPSFVSDGEVSTSGIGFWHIVAFAWICNLAMHIGLSDMALLRYARRSWYGVFSAFGMYLGHYVAWICAGVMGAAAAQLAKPQTPLVFLDSGEVAFAALGWMGAAAVVIAGWTTANPTLYRAGLALQVVTPGWPRWLVTLIAGAITTAIACFPFVFRHLLDFVGIYGLLLMPVGAIVVVEHWIFPRIGLAQYWSSRKGQLLNWPALVAWGVSLTAALFCWQTGLIHLFFLCVPVWLLTAVLYIALASVAGAGRSLPELPEELPELPLSQPPSAAAAPPDLVMYYGAGMLAQLALGACLVLPILVFAGLMTTEMFRVLLIGVTAVYFVCGAAWLGQRERLRA